LKHLIPLVGCGLFLTSCSLFDDGCDKDDECATGRICEDGECRDRGQPTEYITGGQLTRSFAATGALVSYGDRAFCSATLVAPTKALTAAHCVDGGSTGSIEFRLGTDVTKSTRRSSVTAGGIAVHPQWTGDFQSGNDLAVLTLATPITDVAPSVLTDGAAPPVGAQLTLVGYGRTSGDQITGIRRLARVTLAQLATQTLFYQFSGMGACQGDSGGPAFWLDGGEWKQVGVTSFGDTSCVQYGGYQRVDTHRQWLAAQGVAFETTSMRCGGDGACNGACEEDPDCWSLMCTSGSCTAPEKKCLPDASCDADCGNADPDCSAPADYCRTYGLYGNGYCDIGCPSPDPDCQQISCIPVRYTFDAYLCYWFDAAARLCGTTPVYFDPYFGVYRC
jgi:V8-like Glu-specific endopeptidase